MLLANSVERIISLGGGVSVDATAYLPITLERFASLAAGSGATLIIRNSQRLLPISMERIASLGNGKVIFELQ